MSSRRSVRQLLVAVILGVLVGGGLMAVTPAGAEVSNAVATNWKKIWKKNLKPLADKRYYTKAQSDTKYSTKAETAAGDAASQAAANAATDTKLGGYYKKTDTYSKAESDAKYAPYPKTLRGNWIIQAYATAANQYSMTDISYGFQFASVPTSTFMPLGSAPNAACPGTAAAPQAAPGRLCVYEGVNVNIDSPQFFNPNGGGGASPFGVLLQMDSTAAGQALAAGSWAATPSTTVSASRPAETGGAPSGTGPTVGR